MEKNNIGNEPLLFKDLPKEEQKSLRKEFSQTAEAKKESRALIIVVVIFAAIAVAGAIFTIFTEYNFSFTFPIVFVVILPSVISQQKFEKWLAAKKNIIMKKEKSETK